MSATDLKACCSQTIIYRQGKFLPWIPPLPLYFRSFVSSYVYELLCAYFQNLSVVCKRCLIQYSCFVLFLDVLPVNEPFITNCRRSIKLLIFYLSYQLQRIRQVINNVDKFRFMLGTKLGRFFYCKNCYNPRSIHIHNDSTSYYKFTII